MSPPPASTADAVLVLDDDEAVRFVLARVVRAQGAEPVVAGDAEEARARLAERPFAAALVDKNLPGESGLDFLQWLRAYQPECNALVITGYGNMDSAVEALRLGAFDYVLKPFDLHALGHRLRLALEQRRMRAERARLQALLVQSDRLAALGQLAAGVVHELNNPLAYVLSNLEYLEEELGRLARAAGQRGPDGAPGAVGLAPRLGAVADVLREAREGADRMRGIVRDIRVFARTPSEDARAVDVRQVLDAVLKMASVQLKPRARVVRDYQSAAAVLGSEARLAQVFLNLVVNAAQAMPEGRPSEHEVRVRVRTGEEGEVVAEVEDTGVGIAPEHLARIWEPFFTTKGEGEGTGLGLSICRSLVESMGGRVEVQSAPGRGTTFRVRLPAAGAPAQAGAPREAERPGAPRGRVLLIDDEPGIGAAVGRLLGDEHDVVAHTEPAEALVRVAAGEHFDAVVCDLVMPGMSGADVYAELERMAPQLAQRTVFITGGSTHPAVMAFAQRMGRRCLDKPLDAAALRAVVRGLVTQQAMRAAGA